MPKAKVEVRVFTFTIVCTLRERTAIVPVLNLECLRVKAEQFNCGAALSF